MKYPKEEYVWRIKNASGIELLLMTYELCIVNLEDAKATKDRLAFENYVQKAQDFLMKLMISLDPNYDVSKDLLDVYLDINKILHRCRVNFDFVQVDIAIELLSSLMETFQDIDEFEDDDELALHQMYSELELKDKMSGGFSLDEKTAGYKN